MKSLQRLAAAGLVASSLFSGAAFADDQPAVDTVANGDAMAACVIDLVKGNLQNTFDHAQDPDFAPPEMDAIQQFVVGGMRGCIAAVTGLAVDQIPDVPLPPENPTQENMRDFTAKAQAFNDFMKDYIDEQAFSEGMQQRFPEVFQMLMEKMQELQNQHQQQRQTGPELKL